EDDINLRILLNSKKGSFRFLPGVIPDMTTLVATLPDGGRTVLSNGTIIKGPAIDTIQNTGRRKGNTYTFVFGNYLGAQTARQAISNVIQSVLEVI
ncbi:phage tail fiber protein, partial [Pseudomonas aeruginosa]